MISIKKASIAAACVTMFMASPLLANEVYICKHDTQIRQITVTYATAGQSVPCEVTYIKETGTESLWEAQNLAGYCEEKAAAFVEKQRAWGWECAKQEAMQ